MRTMLILLLVAAVAWPMFGQEGVPGGLQYCYIEYGRMHLDSLAKVCTSTASDTTSSDYWNKIAVWNKPNGGITYFLYHDSLSGYVIADSAILQERHRWMLDGSWTTWTSVISTSANGDTVWCPIPYATTGKYYDLELRAVMKENDSTGTPGSGCVVRGGAIFW